MYPEGEEFFLSCRQAQEVAGKEILRLRRALDVDRTRIDALTASLFRDGADRDRLLAAVEASGRSGMPPRDLQAQLHQAPERLGMLREASPGPAERARLATALEARSALYALLASQEALLEQAIAAERVPFADRERALAALDLAIDRSSKTLDAWLRDVRPGDRDAWADPSQLSRLSRLPDGDVPRGWTEPDPWWGTSETEVLAEPEPDFERAEPERRR